MNKRGQSLIELLIAMTVIIVGLAAVGTMIFSNMRLQEMSTDRLVGSNLAREGVELVKAVRDSNSLIGGAQAFNAGMSSGQDYTGVPRVVNGQFVGFNFAADDFTHNFTILYRSTGASDSGMFIQGPGANGIQTVYRRLVTIEPICSDFTTRASGTQCSPLTQIGVRVTSQVQWTRRSGTKTSTVVDEFFDWR